MTAITTSEARRDLFGLIDRVNQDQTEVEITSKRGSAVLMSKDEYDALVETSYLLRSPENARRLLSSLEAAREGRVTEHQLEEATPAAFNPEMYYFPDDSDGADTPPLPAPSGPSGQLIRMLDDPEERPIG